MFRIPAIAALFAAALASSAVLAGDYSDAILADGPLSYWRFDDASTGYSATAADEQGNNPGTYDLGVSQVSGAPINDAGNMAAAFDFGYVDVGTLPGFGAAMDTGVTVEMWVKSPQTSEGIPFGIGGSSQANQFFVNLDERPGGAAEDNRIRVYGRGNGDTTYGGVDEDTSITDDAWHYLAITYVGNDAINVYMASPGEELTTALSSVTVSNAITESSDFGISTFLGALNHETNGAQQYFAGTLDEVAVYDTPLQKWQLDNHFRATDPNLDPIDPPEPVELLLQYTCGTAEEPTLDPEFVVSDATATAITGTNVTARADRDFLSPSLKPVIDLAGLDQTTAEDAIADGDYFEFSITPDAGAVLDFDTLTFAFAKGGGSGERYFFIQANIGEGGAFEEIVPPTTHSVAQPSFTDMEFALDAAAFDEIADTLTFRFYGYCGSDARTLEFDDIELYGRVVEGGSEGIPGDLDGDGFVGSSDLDIVRGNWGNAVPAGNLLQGDPSGDGSVGSADLDIIRANWGNSEPASVPEPGGLVLMVIGVIGFVARRR